MIRVIVEDSPELAEAVRQLPPQERALTVAELIQLLESIPHPALIVMINGRLAGPDVLVQPGDTLHLIPAIAGG